MLTYWLAMAENSAWRFLQLKVVEMTQPEAQCPRGFYSLRSSAQQVGVRDTGVNSTRSGRGCSPSPCRSGNLVTRIHRDG